MSFIPARDFPIPGESAVIPKYDFDAANGNITMSDHGLVVPLIVINVTTGQVIYNPAKPALTGAFMGNKLTLTLDTSSMSNGDELLIIAAVNRHTRQHTLLDDISDKLSILTTFVKELIS